MLARPRPHPRARAHTHTHTHTHTSSSSSSSSYYVCGAKHKLNKFFLFTVDIIQHTWRLSTLLEFVAIICTGWGNTEPGPQGWVSLKDRDNKLCSWVPWDSDLRKTVLSMPGKNWKLQTRLLIREGAPHQQTRNCLKNNQRENGLFKHLTPGWVKKM
jgi:hypothetical protein